MSRSANVTSIDAVKQFRLALMEFNDAARDAVTHLMLQSQKAVDWVDVDMAQYWPRQVLEAMNRVNEARINLERCQTEMGGGGRACEDQQKQFEIAKQRLQLAKEKVELTKQWRMKINHDAEEFHTVLYKLSSMLDVGVPRATGALERMGAALDKYTQASAPADLVARREPPDDSASEATDEEL